MIREFIVSHEDMAPRLFNWARYFKHVVVGRSMTYPDILGPMFEKMGARELHAIDVGANAGIFTRYLSKYFARTHAIEPIPHLARRLEYMPRARVSVYNCALGAGDGEITMRTPLDARGKRMDALTTASPDNNFELFGHNGTVETVVKQHRLSSLIGADAKVGFIKIDVEGFENQVIEGALEMLARDRPVLLIEISRTHNPNYLALLEHLVSLGYHGYVISNTGFTEGVEKAIRDQPDSMEHENVDAPEPQWDFIFFPSNNYF